MNIRISDKHGLNPSIPICFFCGKEKNELVLFGKLPGDKKASRYYVIDYEPCDKCKENMAFGIILMESKDGKTPTGDWCVVTEDCIKRMFDDETAEHVLKIRKAYVDLEVMEILRGK